jgi:Utp14 protein
VSTIAGSTKLNLDDLLAPLASQSTNLLGLKKSAKVLASTSGAKTLSAPLPLRTQERIDREAAYEQTKEEVDKWTETMKRIKEAEHLSFPLQAQPTGRVSNLELAAKFKVCLNLFFISRYRLIACDELSLLQSSKALSINFSNPRNYETKTFSKPNSSR